MRERLQKVMAHAGVASRRECEQIILSGRVKVNHQVVRLLGTQVGPNDKVEVDGVPIYREEPVYYLFYKPKNVLSTVKDDRNRPTVMDYFTGVEQRIYPVGRLDFDTTGLLLMTNDGAFAQRIMHPKHKTPKVYQAKVKGMPQKQDLNRLAKGIVIDGKKTAPAQVRVKSVNSKKETAVLELTIHEGFNHQVKKMCQAVGLPVITLKRNQVGSLHLGQLSPGQWRMLKKVEVNELLNQEER